MDAALPGEQLERAHKKIANLLEDIGRLSEELQKKDSLLATLKFRLPKLSSWLETSQTGELQHSTAGTLRDTVVWEPPSLSTCQRPYCSTPSKGAPWSEVVVRSQRRASGRAPHGAPPSFSIPLNNKYSALSVSAEPPVRVPGQGAAPADPGVPPLSDTSPFPPLTRPGGRTSSTG